MGEKQYKHAHMNHLRSSQCWRGVYDAFVRIPGLFSAISKKQRVSGRVLDAIEKQLSPLKVPKDAVHGYVHVTLDSQCILFKNTSSMSSILFQVNACEFVLRCRSPIGTPSQARAAFHRKLLTAKEHMCAVLASIFDKT
jgi:hypothetical protein